MDALIIDVPQECITDHDRLYSHLKYLLEGLKATCELIRNGTPPEGLDDETRTFLERHETFKIDIIHHKDLLALRIQ